MQKHSLPNIRVGLSLLLSTLFIGCGSSGESTKSETPAFTPAPTPTICSTSNPLVIVSASDEGSLDNKGPLNAIDGDTTNTSRWASNGIGKTITFDLGEESTIRDINIQWYQGNLHQYHFAIHTSTNNLDWTSVLSDAHSSGAVAAFEWVELVDSSARYLRLTGSGNSTSELNSIVEVQINGCGSLAPQIDSNPDIPTQSSIDMSLWDNEGGNPLVGNDYVFDALKAQYVSPNGSGWRHELKIKKDLRVAMTEVDETFYANVSATLSVGAKLIVAQHHGGDTGTLVKVYIADSRESGFIDSVANNGIFDVYVRLAKQDGSGETKHALGTIQSGDNFDLRIINNFGYVSVSAFDQSVSQNVADSAGAYFKFGNYLQAQDAATLSNIENSADWAQFYQDANITQSEVVFSRVNYTRLFEQ